MLPRGTTAMRSPDTPIEWLPLSTENSLQSNEDTAHPKINKYNDFKAIQSKIGCNWPIPSTITWEDYWIFCRQNKEIVAHCAIGIVGSSLYSADSTVEMYQWGPWACLLSLSPSQFGSGLAHMNLQMMHVHPSQLTACSLVQVCHAPSTC